MNVDCVGFVSLLVYRHNSDVPFHNFRRMYHLCVLYTIVVPNDVDVTRSVLAVVVIRRPVPTLPLIELHLVVCQCRIVPVQ